MITSTGSLGWLRASWAIAARRSVTAPEQPAMRIGRWAGIVFVGFLSCFVLLIIRGRIQCCYNEQLLPLYV
jgi:hypothetical protein